MSGLIPFWQHFLLLASLLVAWLGGARHVSAAPPPPANREILIGVEYALRGRAKALAGLGIPAVKHLPDSVRWDKMQSSADAAIDFSRMDAFVREYQEAGFREIVLGLKSQCSWGSHDVRTNFTPKPEFVPQYEAWVRSVVERYDGDGQADMPGLRYPIRYFEIGTELSSFEPEPVADYLAMLERAYRAAHAASDEVKIAHTAFLVTTAFLDQRRPDRLTPAFHRANRRKLDRRLDDMRVVLTRPDLFDVVNFHALGDPYEIEYTVAWLRNRTKDWPVPKPVIISDTAPHPLVGWGPATTAAGDPTRLGVILPPGTEADRPRLAAFFEKLVDGDPATLQWTHAFAAEDMVKKVVIAAEQQVTLINTSFTEDMPLFKTKLFRASAGLSPWGGMVEVERKLFAREWTVRQRRPLFYAVRQLQEQIRGYRSVARVEVADPRLRVYRFERAVGPLLVAWLEPGTLLLPSDPTPKATYAFPTRAAGLTVEEMIHRPGQAAPQRTPADVRAGTARIELTPRPVYIDAGG